MRYFYFLIISFYLINKINNQIITYYDTSFNHGEKLNLISGYINSFKTQIPYDLYYLDLCAPDDMNLFPLNLGEIMLAGRFYQTNYQLNVNQSVKCKFLCSEKIHKRIYKKIKSLIDNEYFINYYLDNLPVGLAKTVKNENNKINKQIRFDTGIPLGFIENNITYIYNYYKIDIELNEVIIYDQYNDPHRKYNIIGFYIEPFSIKFNETNKCIKNNNFEKQEFLNNEYINFYYDVNYIYTNIKYDDRIDKYYLTNNTIHWNSISISCFMITFLSLILIYIFFHSIKSDKNINNARIISDDEINEYGWRNIALEVFRTPGNSEFLFSALGLGVQLFFMLFYTLLFVSIGILKPRNGGSYFTIMIMLYIICGLFSGIVSSKFYKMVNGRYWILLMIISFIFFPIIFIIFIIVLDIIYKKENSSVFIEINNIISLIRLWFFLSNPLIFIGQAYGYIQEKTKLPCKVSPLPILIHHENIPWYLRIRYAWIFTGFPSFFSIFVELFYIMDSLWRQNIYSLDKYLLYSLFVLIITSSEIAILFTYFNLCKGDYRWWWKSFLVGGSPGLYLIIFSIIYIFKMDLNNNHSIIICLSYMILISIIVTIICASAGLFFTFFFIKVIYSKINLK